MESKLREAERERFQMWWGTRHPADSFKRTKKSGAYDNVHINNSWIVWQAALSQPVPSGKSPVPPFGSQVEDFMGLPDEVKLPVAGSCPSCGEKMLDNTAFYVCQNPYCQKMWSPVPLSQPTQWRQVKLESQYHVPVASAGEPAAHLTEHQRKELATTARTLSDPVLDTVHRELELIAYVESLASARATAALAPTSVQVAGRMEQTFAEHTRRLGLLITEEQWKPLPNNVLIAALCDSIRLAREATVIIADAAAPPATERGVREALTFDAWWNWFKGSLGSVTPRDVSIACSAWNQARALAAAAQPTDKEATDGPK